MEFHIMPKSTAERVQQRRDKLRAAGLRPVQIWVPDTRAPGFTEEVRRQCRMLAAVEDTPQGRENAAFWEAVIADAWDGLE
jgi:Protein  of unknown function (DUF3018)